MTIGKRTVFGDLREHAVAVYRVTTQGSVYVVGFHTDGHKRHVIVRGLDANGQAVILRDSDPRIGDQSLFDVPAPGWVGQCLQIATMTSSPIEVVGPETDPAALGAVGHGERDRPELSPWARPEASPGAGAGAGAAGPTVVEPPGGSQWHAPAPPGMSESPRIVPQGARGTLPVDQAKALDYLPNPGARALVVGGAAPVPATPAAMPAYQPRAQSPNPGEPELPYPLRHLHYAESIVQLFRSIARRERIFEDLAATPAYKERMRRALDDCATLLEQIRRRDR